MARTLLTILDELEQRIEQLQGEMEDLRRKYSELEEQNAYLIRQEEAARRAREAALADVEYLKISYRLAASPDSLVETRKIIAGLIRNIDRCIEMLKE